MGKRSIFGILLAVQCVELLTAVFGLDFHASDLPTSWPDGGLHGGLAVFIAHTVVLWWISHGVLALLVLAALVASWICPLHGPMEGYMLVWHLFIAHTVVLWWITHGGLALFLHVAVLAVVFQLPLVGIFYCGVLCIRHYLTALSCLQH